MTQNEAIKYLIELSEIADAQLFYRRLSNTEYVKRNKIIHALSEYYIANNETKPTEFIMLLSVLF